MIFTIYGEPISKLRPRVTRHGTYNPKRSSEYATMVKVIMMNHKQLGKIEKIDKPAPVKLRLTFYLHSKATSVPDIINLAAQIADCLEGICYDNDSQITELDCKKSSSNKPRVLIEVTSVS